MSKIIVKSLITKGFLLCCVTILLWGLIASTAVKARDYGEFSVSMCHDGEWETVGSLSYGKFFTEQQIRLSGGDLSGEITVAIDHYGTSAAHIDAVTLGGVAPSRVTGTDADEAFALMKLASNDYDVIDAQGRSLNFTFHVDDVAPILSVVARIEAEHILEVPFQFPPDNLYQHLDESSSFYTYSLNSQWGRLIVDGELEGEYLGMPFFQEYCQPGSGHPAGYTYGWVCNDHRNLYVAIDFTSDNTMDGDVDYAKVYVKTPNGLREFKISVPEQEWGVPGFTYTSRAAYEHKVYEFEIPLTEIGVVEPVAGEVLEIAFAAYGTATAIWYDPKMHFPQMPNPSGWAVDATGNLLADDWLCTKTGAVEAIQFWGSWEGGSVGIISEFIVRIYADIPVNPAAEIMHSRPGDLLWERTFSLGQFSVYPVKSLEMQGWYRPCSGTSLNLQDHQGYYEYKIQEIADPFIQQEGTVYWLSISAVVAQNGGAIWGWKSSLDRWNDDAVCGEDWQVEFHWVELWEPSVPIVNDFSVAFNPDGSFDGGGGTDYFGLGWYEYPNTNWWNIWFYDHPYVEGRKDISITFGAEPWGPGAEFQVAVNWSTPEWSLVGNPPGENREPPLPPLTPEEEALYIGREILVDDGVPEGKFYEDIIFEIHDYNPEWVSIDVRGTNLSIEGTITHKCSRSLDLAFVILGQAECGPTPDGQGCKDIPCPNPDEECRPKCVNLDFNAENVTVTECECVSEEDCRIDISEGVGGPCIVDDNGTGTATLPPMDCQYASPDELWQIIDGLPPGSTIEGPGILEDFLCNDDPNCTLPLAPGECETSGGSLGGDGHCFEATLDLTLHGTGDLAGFNRHLAVLPVFCEVHTGPRVPGDPVQTFPADMYRLQGELFGDPDFCTFRVRGGTDLGLPSPGQTTITDLGGGLYHIDSFFDITYQIEFEGCPGSVLDG
ncbi:MAG: hypothetical protein JSV84_05650, partial [Gemmatimonadota bacterium]